MPELHEITDEMREKFAQYWRQRVAGLKLTKDFSRKVISELTEMTKPECCGYGQGEVRPGELGQWDVYCNGQYLGWTEDERLLTSGLKRAQVEKADREDEIRDFGLDPDNPEDVRLHNQLKKMTPTQLALYIARSKLGLGLKPIL